MGMLKSPNEKDTRPAVSMSVSLACADKRVQIEGFDEGGPRQCKSRDGRHEIRRRAQGSRSEFNFNFSAKYN